VGQLAPQSRLDCLPGCRQAHFGLRNESLRGLNNLPHNAGIAATKRAGPVLPLHPPRAAAFEQGLDFLDGGTVEIAHHGMLETTGGDREFERLAMRRERQVAVDQAGRKAIAAESGKNNRKVSCSC